MYVLLLWTQCLQYEPHSRPTCVLCPALYAVHPPAFPCCLLVEANRTHIVPTTQVSARPPAGARPATLSFPSIGGAEASFGWLRKFSLGSFTTTIRYLLSLSERSNPHTDVTFLKFHQEIRQAVCGKRTFQPASSERAGFQGRSLPIFCRAP